MNVAGILLHPKAEAQLDAYLQVPSHAVLLGGPVGSGKTHIARALAAQLLGTSESSLQNQAYYRVVTAEKDSISIDQIRNLIKFFKLRVPGTSATNRVAVVEDADAMGHEAQNALLKLLEEPPEASALILTSSRPEGLLPTIQSRVQLLQLATPTPEQAQEHFIGAGHAAAAVQSALLRSGTNMAEAARLLSTEGGTPDSTIALVKQVLAANSFERMLLVDGLSKQKEAASAFADTLATVAMVSLEAAASKGAATIARWTQVLQAAQTAQSAFERSGNAKLVLTELMLSL